MSEYEKRLAELKPLAHERATDPVVAAVTDRYLYGYYDTLAECLTGGGQGADAREAVGGRRLQGAFCKVRPAADARPGTAAAPEKWV